MDNNEKLSPNQQLARTRYEQGMQRLAYGLAAVGALYTAGAAFAYWARDVLQDPTVYLWLIGLAVACLVLAIGAVLRQVWVNYVVGIGSVLLLVVNLASLAVRDPRQVSGMTALSGVIPLLIMAALLFFAVSNLRAHFQAKAKSPEP